MAIQTVYQETLDEGRVGHIVNTELKNLISRNVEGDGGLGFGIAVSRGANDRGCKQVASGETILGVVTRERSVDANNVDVVGEGVEARLINKGVVYVQAAGAVSQGDSAYFVIADGNWTNAAATGAVQYSNAEFDTSTTSAGVVRLRIS